MQASSSFARFAVLSIVLRLSVAIVALGCVVSSPAAACTVTLAADGNTAAIQHAMDRPGKATPVVCLKPGIYKGARLIATRSVVLRRVGKDKVVLDAGGQGRVLSVTQDHVAVQLEGLTLTNGKADKGGAVALLQASKVALVDCWLYGNTATLQGGGAIYANAGQLDIVRSRLTGNSAELASAIALTGVVEARLVGSLVADNEGKGSADPPIRLSGSAKLALLHSTVAYNSGAGIVLQPDGPGRRKLSIASSIVMGRPDAIAVQRGEAGDVQVDRSVLWGSIGFVALDMATQRGLPGFNLKDVERYRPEKGSLAIGLGRCTEPQARKDLAGKPRGAVCTAGALEAPAADVAATLAERRKAPTAQKKTRGWQDI